MASPRQQEKFREVKQLLQQDILIREIARKFKMSRITVRKYKHCEELPRKMYISPTGLKEHLGYIKKRKAENPDIQLRQLHTELKSRGYQGAYPTLSDGLARHSLAIEPGVYKKWNAIFKDNKAALRRDSNSLKRKSSDIMGRCKKVLLLLRNINDVFQNCNFALKQKLVRKVFETGLTYDGKVFRTSYMHPALIGRHNEMKGETLVYHKEKELDKENNLQIVILINRMP